MVNDGFSVTMVCLITIAYTLKQRCLYTLQHTHAFLNGSFRGFHFYLALIESLINNVTALFRHYLDHFFSKCHLNFLVPNRTISRYRLMSVLPNENE